jgi:hypothetical protein
MNFIIAILLATTLTFAYLFLKERKKIAHKNYEIDELHKIMDEMKYGQYKKNDNDLALIQAEKGITEYERQRNLLHLEVFFAQGKAQQQNYSYQQAAAMQNAASRGNGSGYGLNNAFGMLGMGSRL